MLLLALGELTVRGPLRALDESPDLGLYYCSARAMMSGADPYDLPTLQQIARQTGAPGKLLAYAIAPPTCLVPLLPLAVLDWPQAKAVWMAANLLLAGALVAALAALSGTPPGARSPLGILLAALVVGMAPLQTCIGLGQFSVAGVAWVAGGLYAEKRGRPALAGAMMALAACYKPQIAAFFLAYWLLRRRWKGLGAAVLVGGVAAAICALQLRGVSPAFLSSWGENLQRASAGGIADVANPGQGHNFINLQYPLHQWSLGPGLSSILAWAFAAGVAGGAAWAWRRRPSQRDELLMAALIAVVSLLPIYHVWYDAALLSIPLCWGLAALERPGLRWHARATVLLILPFLLPGAAILQSLGPGYLPARVWSSWWMQGLLVPYQAYLAAALAIVLLAAVWRQSRQSAPCCLAPPASV
jgi:hypothetical protein